ncbi:ATP-binding protein [uncultured Friedmanniella sp.]|uniref:ATP-binding protein n=1 Tax=uncultured Friedmanniella sp. TaxID=335381 RepID=UPI0035C995E6
MTRRQSRRSGLRLRIAATIAGLVVVTVAVLGVGVHLLVVENRVRQARAAADERLQAALQIRAATGLLSFDARVNDPSVPAELRSAVARDGARATLVSGGSTRRIWAAGRAGDEVLSTVTTFQPADEGVQDVDRALLLAGLAAVLLATGAGALSANRLSRRLRLAARTARTVADSTEPTSRPAGDAVPSLRSAVGTGQDEVGDLADAVDAMAARLGERLRVEQRFTADVAHDLRTPVTGLIAAAALLDDSRPAVLVRDRAVALSTLVEELLEVARLDSGVETAELEHVRLPEVVTRALQRGVAKGEYTATDVTLQVRGAPVTVLTDPRRLERVLSNLVRNARQHGAPPVVVQVEGPQLVVRDHGPGFEARLLEVGPERFLSTRPGRGGGHGLGLVIAAGQAVVLGAPLRLGNAEDGGAQVVLRLPDGGPPRFTATSTGIGPGTGT